MEPHPLSHLWIHYQFSLSLSPTLLHVHLAYELALEMRFKLLSLQMIPWCSHVAGGATCRSDEDASPASSPAHAVRVVGADGRLRVYERAVGAAELMREHPRHLLCRSDALVIGQRVPPLSPADRLQPGHSYFLLPAPFFHSVLSFLSLASSLSSSSSDPCNKRIMLRPFEIQKTDSGKLQILVSDEFLDRIRQEEEQEEKDKRENKVCTTEALEKDYKQLVRCKTWKPKLETIREYERRGGRGFGGIRRRRKRTIEAQLSKEPKPSSSSSSSSGL